MLLLLQCGGGDNVDSKWNDVWWDAALIMLVSSQQGGNDNTKAKERNDENNMEHRILYK